jgi:hypothetical protein
MKHLGNVTKDSKFNLFDPTLRTDPSKAYQSVLFIVQAGLLSNGVSATPEEIEKWVDDLPIESITEIQWHGFAAISGKSVDELKNESAQTAKQNGKVA